MAFDVVPLVVASWAVVFFVEVSFGGASFAAVSDVDWSGVVAMI